MAILTYKNLLKNLKSGQLETHFYFWWSIIIEVIYVFQNNLLNSFWVKFLNLILCRKSFGFKNIFGKFSYFIISFPHPWSKLFPNKAISSNLAVFRMFIRSKTISFFTSLAHFANQYIFLPFSKGDSLLNIPHLVEEQNYVLLIIFVSMTKNET